MDIINGEGVPSLEGHSARKGTVNAESLGAARFWFKEAKKLRATLRRRRALAFSAGMLVTAAADFVIRAWVL